jgi:sensor histidine kinase regulating citrate/malate metabolism
VPNRLSKITVFAAFLLVVATAVPAIAGPVPSKTATNQSLEARQADLSAVRSIAANEQISAALQAHGLSQQEIDQRLGQMSDQDLAQLANNLEQVQAAGLTRQEWVWIGIGALAALILIVALS